MGGVDENNMADYLKAGVCGFGVGSNIIDKKMIESEDYKGITELAKNIRRWCYNGKLHNS